MLGEISALAGAFTWAVNSVLIRSQSSRLSALSLNAIQYAAATLPFILLLPLSGRLPGLAQIPPLAFAALFGTALVSMVGGDTAYVSSLRLLGVSKAFPIAMCTYPLISSVVAVAFLGEPLTWQFAGGAPLVLLGLYLLSPSHRTLPRSASPKHPTMPPNSIASLESEPAPASVQQADPDTRQPNQTRGVVYALIAAVCWATAVLTLKQVLTEVDAFSATAVRVPFAALVLVPLAVSRGRRSGAWIFGWRSLAIVGTAGIVGVALGTVLFMLAIQNAGAARATVLFATAPLFALVLSVLFLRESVTLRVALGTVVSVAGICLVLV